MSPAYATVSTGSAPRALRNAGPLDGIVQIGTVRASNELTRRHLQDMTILQTRTSLRGLGTPVAEGLRFVCGKATTKLRTVHRVLSHQPLGRRLGRARVRHRAVEGARAVSAKTMRSHRSNASGATPAFFSSALTGSARTALGVVHAFGRLREEVPAARLELVGGLPAVNEPGVTGHGALRPDVPEHCRGLEALFAQATCFVMPSHSEASAILYVEAAAAGLPSIGTIAGSSDYPIGDGGLVVDPGSDDKLLDAMRKLSIPQTAARMGAAARQRARMFTWANVARRLLTGLDGAPPEPGAEVAAR